MSKENFQIEVRSESHHHVVELRGVLDAACEGILTNLVEPLCQKEAPLIVIDCAQLTYVNSATFGLFFHFHRICEAQHGRLVVCRMSPKIESILKLLGLFPVLNIHPTLEDALNDTPAVGTHQG